MTIPDFQSWFLPCLQLLADRQGCATSEMSEVLADQLGLSQRDRTVMLDSGKQLVYKNRIAWSRTYLNKAGVIDSPSRGFIVSSIGEEMCWPLTLNHYGSRT